MIISQISNENAQSVQWKQSSFNSDKLIVIGVIQDTSNVSSQRSTANTELVDTMQTISGKHRNNHFTNLLTPLKDLTTNVQQKPRSLLMPSEDA